MADFLKKHLKEKCEQPALALLESQWGFDEKLIPKALQAIGVLFPHYSRHDESHSKQILVNIERLLGDDIKLLSATDIWLLLEAAYWHDIGMVVPWEEKNSAFNSPEFQEFLVEISQEKTHDLSEFASSILNNKGASILSLVKAPIEAVDHFTFLMAEWFRRQHAGRAKHIVSSPMETIGLSSPRTELIPARLFRVLGRVCEMHGRGFNDIMSADGLPFREAGLGQDDCHPRYVACLLRLGDLLDLDDNRFCPVMQQIAGEGRPALSKSHEEKHLSIRHLRVDRERIEIKAECHTLDSYSETCKWFDWLSLEIQMQMANWQEIVPSRGLGLLPTLGALEVSMNGDFQILKKGQRPEFGIDRGRAFELIRGANLYQSEFDSVREVLQNAVDATLVALWIQKNSFPGVDWSTPETASSTLRAAFVEVRLEEGDRKVCDRTGRYLQAWVLTITDEGTGISFEDLEFIRNIGASQKNKQRQAIIKSMPQWMRPSGAFGIGIHSAFIVAPVLSFDTKSIIDNQSMEISLYSPACKESGLFVIKKKANDIYRKHGTSLSIEMLLPADSEDSFFSRRTIHGAVAQNFDPLFADDYPYSIGVADYIVDFFSRSLVSCTGNIATKRHGVISFSQGFSDSDRVAWDYIDVGSGRLVGVVLEDLEKNAEASGSRFYYRGQPFKFPLFFRATHRKLGFNFRFNVVFGRADEWLTADRNNVALSSVEELRGILYMALQKKIQKDDFAGDNERRRRLISLFLVEMASIQGGDWSLISTDFGDQWQEITFDKGSLSDLLRANDWTFSRHLNGDAGKKFDLILARESLFVERIVFKAWLGGRKVNNITALSCIEYIGEDEYLRISEYFASGGLKDLFSAEDWKKSLVYKMSKGRREPYTLSALRTKLSISATKGLGNKRLILPISKIIKDWEILAVRSEVVDKFNTVFDNVRVDHPQLLLPFLFKKSTRQTQIQASYDDAFCEKVRLLLREDLSLEIVRGLYVKLIEHVDDLMAGVEEWEQARY